MLVRMVEVIQPASPFKNYHFDQERKYWSVCLGLCFRQPIDSKLTCGIKSVTYEYC